MWDECPACSSAYVIFGIFVAVTITVFIRPKCLLVS
jgi:hypothetical protein